MNWKMATKHGKRWRFDMRTRALQIKTKSGKWINASASQRIAFMTP